MLAEPTRLYDYTYTQWKALADRNAPNWSEDQLDESWMRHIEMPVRAGNQVEMK